VENSRELAAAVKAQLWPAINYGASGRYSSVGADAERQVQAVMAES
jgi:hypothetical protein